MGPAGARCSLLDHSAHTNAGWKDAAEAGRLQHGPLCHSRLIGNSLHEHERLAIRTRQRSDDSCRITDSGPHARAKVRVGPEFSESGASRGRPKYADQPGGYTHARRGLDLSEQGTAEQKGMRIADGRAAGNELRDDETARPPARKA